MGKIVRMEPKPTFKSRDVSWPSSSTQNQSFQNYRPEPPPPPPPPKNYTKNNNIKLKYRFQNDFSN